MTKPNSTTNLSFNQDAIRMDQAWMGFLRRHDVHAFKNSSRNITALLRSSGASEGETRRVQALLGRCGAHSGPFDHGRLFGRDRRPTILVGHPYGLNETNTAILDEIRALGLVVQVNGPESSFYNSITCQVIVFAAGVSPEGVRPTGIEANAANAASEASITPNQHKGPRAARGNPRARDQPRPHK